VGLAKAAQQDDERVDILENKIRDLSESLLAILLKDRSTGKNIIWGTDNYSKRGARYAHDATIEMALITDKCGDIIRPRTKKGFQEQKMRIRDKAEVFTPSWICNMQNNAVDDAWFGIENCFNVQSGKTWTATAGKIDFSKSGKTWQDYVLEKRLEITCGEAPYLVSRYDTTTGEIMEPKNRIGLLDRKIRVVNENAAEDEWYAWVKRAFQSIYGFEWQGDSLLIARENLLYTFCDYYSERYGKQPSVALQKEIAEIISWNIWQMDGLKGVVPNSCRPQKEIPMQFTFFDDEPAVKDCEGCTKGDIKRHTGTYCIIKDWVAVEKKGKSTFRFVDLMGGIR